jgi:hypothetical protein
MLKLPGSLSLLKLLVNVPFSLKQQNSSIVECDTYGKEEEYTRDLNGNPKGKIQLAKLERR